jgi:hypothetical protein
MDAMPVAATLGGTEQETECTSGPCRRPEDPDRCSRAAHLRASSCARWELIEGERPDADLADVHVPSVVVRCRCVGCGDSDGPSTWCSVPEVLLGIDALRIWPAPSAMAPGGTIMRPVTTVLAP